MSPIEKKWEECFGLKFFDREWRNIKQELLLNDENHKLGDVPHWNYQVSGLPTSKLCFLSNTRFLLELRVSSYRFALVFALFLFLL